VTQGPQPPDGGVPAPIHAPLTRAALPPNLRNQSLRDEARYLLVAVQFLTRIPVPGFAAFELHWLDRAAKYFPLVGGLVGVLSGFALIAASWLWQPLLASLIAVAVGVLVTGAFHEDGLADTADGLGGGLTITRRLEIMRDSRIGTYGAVALLLGLAMKVTALSALDVTTGAAALVAAHAAGRLATVAAIAGMTYAGDADGAKIKPLATGLSHRELAVAGMFGLAPTLLLDPTCFVLALIGGALPALWLARQSQRLIGGYTGDVLGAIEQVVEIGFLLAVAAQGTHLH
jgi:adenosylcobinamide-GDP ribazoletransferase